MDFFQNLYCYFIKSVLLQEEKEEILLFSQQSKSSNMKRIDLGTEQRTNTRDQPSPDHQR